VKVVVLVTMVSNERAKAFPFVTCCWVATSPPRVKTGNSEVARRERFFLSGPGLALQGMRED
jgi:hypothetical protein